MICTLSDRNKMIVLEAFDALFNRRDYAAAERFWSPVYVQHSAFIGQDAKACSSSLSRFRPLCATSPDYWSPMEST